MGPSFSFRNLGLSQIVALVHQQRSLMEICREKDHQLDKYGAARHRGLLTGGATGAADCFALGTALASPQEATTGNRSTAAAVGHCAHRLQRWSTNSIIVSPS